MMLTLLVAGLAIGCSSAPEAPAAPAAPAARVANLTEKEAIAIARSSERDTGGCFQTEAPENTVSGSAPNESYRKFTDFTHSESASFKPSGIWVVMAKSSWNWRKDETGNWSGGECGYVVNDATGKVTQN